MKEYADVYTNYDYFSKRVKALRGDMAVAFASGRKANTLYRKLADLAYLEEYTAQLRVFADNAHKSEDAGVSFHDFLIDTVTKMDSIKLYAKPAKDEYDEVTEDFFGGKDIVFDSLKRDLNVYLKELQVV